MLILGQDAKMIGKLKEALLKSFDMKDLGSARQMVCKSVVTGRQGSCGYHRRSMFKGV